MIMDAEKYRVKLHNQQIMARNGQCRLWTGTTKNCGTQYGVMSVLVAPGRWRQLYTHRLAFQFHVGWSLEEMDQGKTQNMTVSHLCHNSLCQYAPHLSWESDKTNGSRGYCVHAGQCTGHGDFPDCMLNLRL